MTDDRKLHDVTFIYKDKGIYSTIEPLKTIVHPVVEKEVRNGDGLTFLSLRNGASVKLNSVEIDKNLIGNTISNHQEFSICGIGYHLPRRNKLPKKKRLRKKWLKKYGKEFIIDRCVITSDKKEID